MCEDDDILVDLLRVKGSDIELVVYGVKIEKNDEIEEYKSCERLQFQLQNYSKLEYGLDFEYYIYYNNLIHYLPNHQLPSDLLKKYNNILRLKIDGKIKEKDLLIYVIKKCNNLTELCNAYSEGDQELGQEFYDQLLLISNLRYLFTHDKNLNYDFINKMIYLTYLNVNENIFKNEVYLNDLKFLTTIRISKCLKHSITISKYGKDRYEIIQDLDRPNGNEISLSELTKCVNDYFL